MLIKDCFKRYDQGHLEPSTVAPARARRAWELLEPYFGHLNASEVDEKTLKAYQRSRDWAGISFTTIDRELGVLRAALKWCVRHRLIDYAPYIPNYAGTQKRMRVLSKEEVRKLLMAAMSVPYVYKFLMLALYTGQRREAILDLTWDRVDMDRRTIEFNDEDVYLPERRKGRAHVPIHDRLYEFLKTMRSSSKSEYVVDNRGNSVPTSTLQYGWTKVRKLADLGEEVTPHVIRHTVATDQVGAGVNLEFIAQMLGHKSIRTTEQVYVKRNPKHLVDSVSKLDYLDE